MTSQPSASLLAAMTSQPAKAAQSDSLAKLQSLGREAIDLELSMASLQEQLKEKQERLNKILQSTMVDLMTEVGIDNIGVAPDGNKPGRDFEIASYYSANIAASWPPEKREEGFKLLVKMGAEDMIKTEVSILFPKGGLKAAQKLAKAAKKIAIPLKVVKKGKKLTLRQPVKVELVKAVPSGTLKAWLKELYEERRKSLSSSSLEKIGASVGKIVRSKERVA